jgi:ketosteroid isomerase-like protein
MQRTENTETGTSGSPRPGLSVTAQAERAEDQFFEALLAVAAERLDELLADDFLIVDVMSGGVADRTAFIAALRDRLFEFERVDVVERVTRRYGDTTILVGRTEMSGSLGGAPFSAASRYTHVLVRGGDGRWRLASAQRDPVSALQHGDPRPERLGHGGHAEPDPGVRRRARGRAAGKQVEPAPDRRRYRDRARRVRRRARRDHDQLAPGLMSLSSRVTDGDSLATVARAQAQLHAMGAAPGRAHDTLAGQHR